MKRILVFISIGTLFPFDVSSQLNIVSQNITCNGNCDGSAQVTPVGNYHYVWNTGDTTATINNLCGGADTVIVSDSLYNPLDTLIANIYEPAPLLISGSAFDVVCYGGNDGAIILTVSGGTPAYSYLWNDGYSLQNRSYLATGNYSVTVVDTGGCSATAAYTVNQPGQLTPYITVTDASSCSACDGSETTNVTGGVAPYTFSWSGGIITQTRNNLCVGYYSITVTDSHGCSATALGAISSASSTLTASITNTGVTCNTPDSTTVTVSGGLPTYIYWGDGDTSNWNSAPFHHSFNTSGIYYISVHDTGGCTYTFADTVLNLGTQVNTLQVVDPNCSGPNSGKIRVGALSGLPPYFFAWSNGSTADSIVNLPSGYYSVTVTDSIGCTASESFALTNTNGFSVYASDNYASCITGGVGNATINTTGGTAPFTYLWGTVPTQNTQTAYNIPPGTYGYTVTDNNSCSVAGTANITFSSYSYYVYMSNQIQPNCGINNGSLTAIVYHGIPPYTFHWNDNQSTPTAVGLGAGYHYVTVTDAGGCSSTGFGYLHTFCYNTINGTIFNDVNGNCVIDSNDTPLAGISLNASNGTSTGWGYSDTSGNYTITLRDTGTFTLRASYNHTQVFCGNLVPCSNPQTVTFSGFNGTVSNQNYGFIGASGFDFGLHPGWTTANPGFQKDYWIYYYNSSSINYSGPGTLIFQYDSNLTYLSSDPPLPAHNIATHTLTWNFTGIGSWDYRGRCHFMVSPALPMGYQLQSDFLITPIEDDCDTSDNHLHFSELVTSSMDPNEKEVTPAGNIQEEDSVLTYTIHFQNTGTDTTWFVIVKDTLNANLDPGSVRNLASSHTYSEFTISGEGILTWVFNPVYLVDSATNEPASKGFVTFSVKKKKNLAIGTPISNRASIVFDYNEPLATNTVTNTFANPLYISEVKGNESISVKVMPNPFTQSTQLVVEGANGTFNFELFDVTGKTLKKIVAINENRFELNREAMSAGVYFYRITTMAKQRAFGRLVVE